MTNIVFRIGVTAAIALSTAGCGTLYTLDVTAYNDPSQDLDKTYVLLSSNPKVDVRSAEFEQYASQVERTLEPYGYTRMYSDQVANTALGIYISVDIGDASKRYHSVRTALYETPQGEDVSAVVVQRGQVGGPGQTGAVLNPVVTPPPDEIIGYEEKGFATTVFTKYLNLVAIDLQDYIKSIAAVGREEAVPREIWSIDVQTTGQPSDLGEVVPVMLAAVEPYIANSTEEVVTVKLSGSDGRVNQIKGQ